MGALLLFAQTWRHSYGEQPHASTLGVPFLLAHRAFACNQFPRSFCAAVSKWPFSDTAEFLLLRRYTDYLEVPIEARQLAPNQSLAPAGIQPEPHASWHQTIASHQLAPNQSLASAGIKPDAQPIYWRILLQC